MPDSTPSPSAPQTTAPHGVQESVTAVQTPESSVRVQPERAQLHSVPVLPARRVGTFTMGVALIATGILLCVGMLFPSYEIWQMFRFAPLLLVMLGVEVLVCHARVKTAPLKYDILSMVLCSIIILFSMGVTAVSAAILYESGAYGTSYHNGRGYHSNRF